MAKNITGSKKQKMNKKHKDIGLMKLKNEQKR